MKKKTKKRVTDFVPKHNRMLGNHLTSLKKKRNNHKMGKRKSISTLKKPSSKKQPGLNKVFACPFCNREKAVQVTMLRKEGLGQLSCKVCGVNFQSRIDYLSESVDVYADWIDTCDATAKEITARGEEEEEDGY